MVAEAVAGLVVAAAVVVIPAIVTVIAVLLTAILAVSEVVADLVVAAAVVVIYIYMYQLFFIRKRQNRWEEITKEVLLKNFSQV